MTRIDPILLQALISQEAYDAGIAPYSFDKLNQDMNRLLADLPPEEARKMRRRFRKLWRNLARKNLLPNSNDLIRSSATANRVGLGKSKPEKQDAVSRKSWVLYELARRARKKASG
jgi:hypothetical protein